MSKVIVGINIDNTVKLPNLPDKSSIDVEVTSIKALDLDNMELVDVGINNCEDVIGIKDNEDFGNTFTITTDENLARVYATSSNIGEYMGSGRIAVFRDNEILAGAFRSNVQLYFKSSIVIRFNLYNHTYKIGHKINRLYDCWLTSAKNKYYDIEIYRYLGIGLDCAGIFNKIEKYDYSLFDIAYIITELHRDVIISNGFKILVIDLEKATVECNVVIPPSVSEVYFSNNFYRNTRAKMNISNNTIIFNVSKSKRDEIVSFMANQLKYPDISHLDDYDVLDIYDLKVACY